MRPRNNDLLRRDGVEFRYAAAALLIACSKADLDEAQEEKDTIRKLLHDTFGVSDRTVERLFAFAYATEEGEYLREITRLINLQFSPRDKHFLLEKLWEVAYADGRIEDQEQAFIERIANEIDLPDDAIEVARTIAQHSRS